MDIFMLINLLGGLAIFLFGMNILSTNLEKASEGRLEATLERLTKGVIRSVLLGAVVTAAIQSSSATTVIVVGLVNAKILKLRQAIGIIMGANIGTTITAHIISLSSIESTDFFMQLIKPTTLAPLFALVGIIMIFSARVERVKTIGNILIGFGVLFTGLFQMENTMKPLAEIPEFTHLFSAMSNPILGVVAGAVVTAVIQSSSASVGILQALASTGTIPVSAAYPIILGQNIGTCITPIMASIGANKGAKRAALVHLSFNLIGTIVFLIGLYTVYYTVGVSNWNKSITSSGIAEFHTLFNFTVTLIFIPFTGLLERVAYRLIPNEVKEERSTDVISTLDDRLLVSPGLAIQHARSAVLSMIEDAERGVKLSKRIILCDQLDADLVEQLTQNENSMDKLQDNIERYAIKISKNQLTERSKLDINEILHMSKEYECIGDMCENLMQAAQKKIGQFSPEAIGDIQLMYSAVEEILNMTTKAYTNKDVELAKRVEPLEQVIDVIEHTLKERHINRLRDGLCAVDLAFPFVEALTGLERIADHCSNIAMFLIASIDSDCDTDFHQYLADIHSGNSQEYEKSYREYAIKYLDKLND